MIYKYSSATSDKYILILVLILLIFIVIVEGRKEAERACRLEANKAANSSLMALEECFNKYKRLPTSLAEFDNFDRNLIDVHIGTVPPPVIVMSSSRERLSHVRFKGFANESWHWIIVVWEIPSVHDVGVLFINTRGECGQGIGFDGGRSQIISLRP